ncbi:hypothetical protein SAMN05444274_101590 [Mariniphaga anaerophila]|uniref:Uncharacterized protein n=1 Tax=Mariniphaga anaerophila TaxID=1484053 RepID=A0A1M4U680_9BACT|nr:hypothetical protein [Mariniphaga anaerophila]SHE52341.1 hypothetical protein SAMN05444274_101590 [Mariniphaga anaerophila]
MKNKIFKSYLLAAMFLLGGLAFVNVSCDDKNKTWDYMEMPSHHDGIQNGDEEGIDCGGSAPNPCPSCTDGIQNQGEEGVDCGGPCPECPTATPRFDAMTGTGIPYFHTFEQDFSGDNLFPIVNNSVSMFFGAFDPAGSEEIVGQYDRPEGNVADGYSDFKFEPFASAIDFSEYDKFQMDVYVPSSNDFSGNLTPLVEVIFYDTEDPTFWNTWTVLQVQLADEDVDKWISVKWDGSELLANRPVDYTGIAIRIGGFGHQEAGTFFVKDFMPIKAFTAEGTPRADALKGTGLSFFHTFEAEDAGETVMHDANQTVGMSFGVADPAGSSKAVGMYTRYENDAAGGYSDYKFKALENPVDFSKYTKFNLDVYMPSMNDYAGTTISPMVEIIFLDSSNGEFWNTWTVMPFTVPEADFDKWVTVTFDGSALLPASVDYDVVAIRMGGSNHMAHGIFYLKDLIPIE